MKVVGALAEAGGQAVVARQGECAPDAGNWMHVVAIVSAPHFYLASAPAGALRREFLQLAKALEVGCRRPPDGLAASYF